MPQFLIQSVSSAFICYFTKANQTKAWPWNLQVWCKGKKRAHKFTSKEEAEQTILTLAVPATWKVVEE